MNLPRLPSTGRAVFNYIELAPAFVVIGWVHSYYLVAGRPIGGGPGTSASAEIKDHSSTQRIFLQLSIHATYSHRDGECLVWLWDSQGFHPNAIQT